MTDSNSSPRELIGPTTQKLDWVTFLIGMVLLVAACHKIIAPFFLAKLQVEHFFWLSVAVDLVVGSILITQPNCIAAKMIGASVFFVYAIYLLSRYVLFGAATCACFGGATPFYYALIFDLTSLFYFVYSIIKSPKIGFDVYFVRMKQAAVGSFSSAFLILLFAGLCSGASQYLRVKNQELQVLNSSSRVEPGNANWSEVQICFRNRSTNQIKLLGMVPSCKLAASSHFPITIAPHNEAEILVNAMIPPDSSISISELTVYYEIDSKTSEKSFLKTARLYWFVHFFI